MSKKNDVVIDARILDLAKKRYGETGDGKILLYAVWLCLMSNYPAPEWLKGCFGHVLWGALQYQVSSWDKLLGPLLKKGERRISKHTRTVNRQKILDAVETARRNGQPINQAFFEQAGKALGMSKTAASDLYYSTRTIPEEIKRLFESE
jgi:hypothetical protein